MTNRLLLLVLTSLLLLSACSSKQIYDVFRSNRLQECETVPRSEREKCIEDMQDSYDDYERKRSE